MCTGVFVSVFSFRILLRYASYFSFVLAPLPSPQPTRSFLTSYLHLSFAPLPSSKLQVVALATAGRRSPFREVVGSPKSLNPLSPDQQPPNQEPMSLHGFTAASTAASTAGNNDSNSSAAGSSSGGGGSGSNAAPPARSWQVGSFRRGSGGGNGGGNENGNENDGPDLDNAAGIQVSGRAHNQSITCVCSLEK